MKRLCVGGWILLAALGLAAVIGDQGRASAGDSAMAVSMTVKDVHVAASVSPGVLAFGGGPVTATLTFVTGALPRKVAIGLAPSTWPPGSALGSPLRVADQTIVGAGHLSSLYVAFGSPPAPGQCNRGGPAYGGGGIILSLPANSSTTVSWRVSLAAKPWAGLQLGLGWIVYVDTAAKRLHELAFRTIAPLAIRRTGPTGVRLQLRAGRGARPNAGEYRYPWARVGRPVQILGTSNPKLSHAEVRVGEISSASHRRRTIATVRTHADGTFQTTWRPRHPGIFTITSAVDHPPGGLLADQSCNLAVDVAPPDAQPPAAQRQPSVPAAKPPAVMPGRERQALVDRQVSR